MLPIHESDTTHFDTEDKNMVLVLFDMELQYFL